jgi:hypothetical protein
MRRDRVIRTTLACAWVTCGSALAQESTSPPPKTWANETELSIVFTEGNSQTNTIGFKDTLTRRWLDASLRFKLEALRSDTSDDWFEQVDPGFTWLPGETPPPVSSTLIKPKSEPDVENYFVEGRYDRTIRKELNWHVGLSWDRNMDAGILGRTIAFGGVGNLWWDRDDLKFHTSYGLAWTDREEESPDPEKEEQFTGVRLGWTFKKKWATTTYSNDWTAIVSIADPNDWSSDMTNAVSVTMSKRLSLRVSLIWLYNNEPALEDVDVVARVVLIDPDGVPGSGDEFFETVSDGGGYEVVVGENRVRREKLDQIFKTTLVVSF